MQTNKLFVAVIFVFVLLNLEGILWKNQWIAKHEKTIRLVTAVVMFCFGIYYLFQ